MLPAAQINYMTAGNRVPHLHTHVTSRYRDDPATGTPLPDEQNVEMPEAQWREDAAALSALLAQVTDGHEARRR